MIFQSIEITDLFTYRDRQVFDLRGAAPGKNVVLIAGRNGFGKTSLLNSVKLLFTGVTDALRQSVQRQRTPSPKQYVIGTGDDWWGIMNRRARDSGVKSCSIRIVWEEDNQEVIVERSWIISESDFEEKLVVSAPFLKEHLTDDEAQRFLDQHLPRDYVPFFFFDGEQIQELAEANRVTQQQHIERLLNIAHIEALREGLAEAVSDWRTSAMDVAEQATLSKLKAGLTDLENQQAVANQKKQSLEYDIGELKGDVKDLLRKLENFRSFMRQQDEVRLKEEKEQLENTLAELCRKVVETLPRDIPLLANPHLAGKAQDELRRNLQNQQTSQRETIEQLLHYLPADLLDRPPHSNPPITQDQRQFYRNRLIKLLEAYAPATDLSEKGHIALDARRAQALAQLLGVYIGSHALRAERVADLKQVQDIKVRLRQIDQDLTNVSALSITERQAYERYKESLEDKQQQLIDLEAELLKLDSDLSAFDTQIAKQRDEIGRQEQKVNLSKHARSKVDLAKKLQGFFAAYKARLKLERRTEVEDALNRHFKGLMTSNRLIQSIRVDEDFGLHYLDMDGKSVGMGNLSAGMKQLAATALLWALKECSGRPLPIIVDTPLARIDRGNQENLLRNYYPNVGQQVIVLPTDSELDEAKYSILKPYIYAEYLLLNPEGDHTEIRRASMYPPKIEVAHG